MSIKNWHFFQSHFPFFSRPLQTHLTEHCNNPKTNQTNQTITQNQISSVGAKPAEDSIETERDRAQSSSWTVSSQATRTLITRPPATIAETSSTSASDKYVVDNFFN
jgi:hypothetical protein